MTPPRILDADGLETAFGSGPYLLFKHSLLCPVAAAAFRELMLFLASDRERPDETRVGWISVTDERPLSNAIAERTGVQHESPQAFVLVNGQVRWHASHGAITLDALSAAWREALAGADA